MKLEQLMEGVPFTLVQGSLDTEIADIIYDSRKAAPGLLFVCIVGTQRDSHTFAADCAAKGVSALVIQHDIDLSTLPGVTVVKVENSRYAMALMSANLFGNPARQMTMIGVTGTKGKTTTTHMIKSVLEAAGRKVGMIGTNGIYYMGRHKDTANTTPESYELQKTFREFLDAGCDTALMEVSSQGLMMDRVAGVHYDVGVFTNLSPDHIGPGEHKTFEEYRSWKGQLFKRCDVGVVNIDDENTAALLEGHTCKLVTYGRDEKADYRETGYELLRTHDFLGVAFHVTGKDEMDVKVNMPGEFSVYNALAALAVGKVLGLPDAAIHDGLGKCVVKGRVELVPISKKFTILLDYAHNEVSTESLLTTLRAYKPHRLVVVFGCGGKKQHPLVGAAMTQRFPEGITTEKLNQYSYEICRHHHERYDGSGYPDGLKGNAIPMCAQVVGIVDAYDALINDRPYKRKYEPEEAIQMISNGECGAFSNQLMQCFQEAAKQQNWLKRKN